jgi:hypothetical protein
MIRRRVGDIVECLARDDFHHRMSLGRQGRALITSISAPMFPAFKPLPKVHDCTLLLPRKGAHRTLSDAWQKLPLVS